MNEDYNPVFYIGPEPSASAKNRLTTILSDNLVAWSHLSWSPEDKNISLDLAKEK